MPYRQSIPVETPYVRDLTGTMGRPQSSSYARACELPESPVSESLGHLVRPATPTNTRAMFPAPTHFPNLWPMFTPQYVLCALE